MTRAKKNIRYRRLYSTPTDRTLGVISDQIIALGGAQAKLRYRDRLRRVRYRDPQSGQTLVFL